MSKEWHKDLEVLIIDDEIEANTTVGRALRAIAEELSSRDIRVVPALSESDGWTAFVSNSDIGCVLVDWDVASAAPSGEGHAERLIAALRERNPRLPIFLATERIAVEQIPVAALQSVIDFLWKTEDTPAFMAGRIEHALVGYAETLFPPFFKELVTYAETYKYAWHTPGHMGGVAFLKSPAGRRFFDFFGENVLRSDLSISVPELGSLLPHSGVVGEAERNAAQTFGADRTFFVTNGTSTSNKIVWQGRVTEGDVVLVDRNCHKSIEHALIMTGAVPVYLVPTRNHYGIIGPIPAAEFTAESIGEKIAANPLIDSETPAKARLAVVTNSTYDGICYRVAEIMNRLAGSVETLHFDEAWFAYAAFHALYRGRYGMHDHDPLPDPPVVFATQSTHKLLAAFSQASMVHLRDRHVPEEKKVDRERFNEAFMMHTSTSPQYGIIASLDVATRMMQHGGGQVMMQDAIEEAIGFRREMYRIRHQLDPDSRGAGSRWWFRLFEPHGILNHPVSSASASLAEVKHRAEGDLSRESTFWEIRETEDWHGYDGVGDGYAMLDPIKVTVLTPGIGTDGALADWGIPAAIVTRFLWTRGIVVEKTGTYSFLLLFSVAITKGKSGTLVAELFHLKELYDSDAALCDVLPALVAEHPGRYAQMSFQELCRDMHDFYKEKKAVGVIQEVYSVLPEQAMTPAQAYRRLVKGQVESLPLDAADGRVNAVGIVPYPPGIPVIMPGERFDHRKTPKILEYLSLLQDFDTRFPGFEHEVHGVEPQRDPASGQTHYKLDCLV